MIRLGLVGLGSWGTRLASAFAAHPRCQLVATFDRDPARPGVPGAARAGSLAELLAVPGCDAIAVATPPEAHAEIAVAALHAGHHVFVEKPLADQLAAATAVRMAAEERGLVCAVGHVLRFHPAVAAAEAALRSGALGELRRVISIRTSPHRLASESPWWNLAPHDVSVANSAFGGVPLSVRATGAPTGCVAATLRYPGERTAELLVEHGTRRRVRRIAWLGARGSLVFDDSGAARLVASSPRSASLGWLESSGALEGEAITLGSIDALSNEIDHFVGAVGDGGPVRSGVAEGWNVVSVLEAGDRSMRDACATVPAPWTERRLTAEGAEW